MTKKSRYHKCKTPFQAPHKTPDLSLCWIEEASSRKIDETMQWILTPDRDKQALLTESSFVEWLDPPKLDHITCHKTGRSHPIQYDNYFCDSFVVCMDCGLVEDACTFLYDWHCCCVLLDTGRLFQDPQHARYWESKLKWRHDQILYEMRLMCREYHRNYMVDHVKYEARISWIDGRDVPSIDQEMYDLLRPHLLVNLGQLLSKQTRDVRQRTWLVLHTECGFYKDLVRALLLVPVSVKTDFNHQNSSLRREIEGWRKAHSAAKITFVQLPKAMLLISLHS